MPLSSSHDSTYAETHRVRADLEHGVGVEGMAQSVESAPINNPRTGRFAPGNAAWRRREMKRLAHEQGRAALLGLDPAKCEDWLRPFAVEAVKHAAELAVELPVQTESLLGLADDAAAARAVYRGLLALGAAGDRDALREARAWMKEARQNTIALRALAKDSAAAQPPKPYDLAAALEAGMPEDT